MEMNCFTCATAALPSRQEAQDPVDRKLGQPQRQDVGSAEHVFLCSCVQ